MGRWTDRLTDRQKDTQIEDFEIFSTEVLKRYYLEMNRQRDEQIDI
jgi:hypothetical protein